MNANLLTVVLWSLWSKSLLFLAPLLLLMGTLVWANRPRTAWLCYSVGLLLFFNWLFVDMRLQFATGNHISDYFAFAFSAQSWEFAGREQAQPKQIIIITVFLSIVMLSLLLLSRKVVQAIFRRLSPRTRRLGVWVASAGYLAVVLSVLPLQAKFGDPDILLTLRDSLPTPMLLWRHGVTSRENGPFQFALNNGLNRSLHEVHKKLFTVRPTDQQAKLPADHRPNIVLIIGESLRKESLSPEMMPRLSSLAKQGLWFRHHFSGGNVSTFGLFSLLYSRSAMMYDLTLDQGLPTQFTETLKRSGYETAFYASGGNRGFGRLEEIFHPRNFDEIQELENEQDWNHRDVETLKLVKKRLKRDEQQPQFVMAFLYTTHFSYEFPPEYARYTPYADKVDILDRNLYEKRTEIYNRYRNAAGYLDEIVANFLEDIDLNDTVVVFTGDHGESILDDGTIGHSSKMSEIQIRTPLFMLGHNIPRGEITLSTTHVDVFPTLLHLVRGQHVPLTGCYGRDVFAAADLPQQFLLTKGGFKPGGKHLWERLLFVQGDNRSLFMIRRDQPGVRFLGLVDHKERRRSLENLTVQDAEEIVKGIDAEFRKMAGIEHPPSDEASNDSSSF